MMKEYLDDTISYSEEDDEDSEESVDDFVYDEDIENSKKNFNVELGGSPLHPKFYTGDSAIPLQGQYPTSTYMDDMTKTWNGILSFYG